MIRLGGPLDTSTYHAGQTYPNNAAAILNIRQFMRLQGLYLAVASRLGSYLITLDTVGYALRAFGSAVCLRDFLRRGGGKGLLEGER